MVEFSMQVLTFEKSSVKSIALTALNILKEGGIVAYPTESYYALGVNAGDREALERLYELKRRQPDKPVPVIVGGTDGLMFLVEDVPGQAKSLMQKFWPGPLTLIFNAVDDVPPLLTGGTGKVAIRIPGKSAALYIAEYIQLPVTATSANHSGEAPAETAEEVIAYFKDEIDLVIDGGRSPGGKPSTIVDVTVTPPRIMREGRVSLKNMKGIVYYDR